jgi:pimeloyl-ACP methyl ester carboxylesterase
MAATASDVVESHRAAGRPFTVAGVRSFVLDQGRGAPVVCLHGVPASSFLYRKVVPELAARGLRGIAFDFPGLGLASRPADFDYSWSGLARWTASAIDALGIDRCHLVVHDIGGPVGFEWAITHPERVLSVTALDTVVDVGTFRPPWPMRPFAQPGLGELWLAGMAGPAWRWLFRREGVADRGSVTGPEIDAYLTLLKREDGGRAFLKIMRGFELTPAKQSFYYDGLAARPTYPTQVVWGQGDRMLGASRRQAVQNALGTTECTLVSGRHFVPEEQAPAIAAAVAKIGARPRLYG